MFHKCTLEFVDILPATCLSNVSCRTWKNVYSRLFVRGREILLIFENIGVFQTITTHFNVEFYYDAVIRRSLIDDNKDVRDTLLRKIRRRQVNRFSFSLPPFFEGNLDLPECVATSTTASCPQLEGRSKVKFWRKVWRTSFSPGGNSFT